MQWLDGEPLVAFETASQEARDAIAVGLFDAWWQPFLRYEIIHGDPHLGNDTVAASRDGGERRVDGVNLFDYGCVRIFPPRFVLGVVELIARSRRTIRRESRTPSQCGASPGSRPARSRR